MWRRAFTCGFLAVVLLLAACSGGSGSGPGGSGESPPGSSVSAPPSSSPTPTCSDQVSLRHFKVVMTNYRFTPDCVVASIPQIVVLVNRGTVVHNFTIGSTGYSVDVRPGDKYHGSKLAGQVQPGTYHFYCKYHRARGMRGVIHILAA